MPCMASGCAKRLRSLGANHLEESHCRRSEPACCCVTQKGSNPPGVRIGSADLGWATICTPQNSHLPATCGGVKIDFAPQLWHCTSSALTASFAICSGRIHRCCSNDCSSTRSVLSGTASL